MRAGLLGSPDRPAMRPWHVDVFGLSRATAMRCIVVVLCLDLVNVATSAWIFINLRV